MVLLKWDFMKFQGKGVRDMNVLDELFKLQDLKYKEFNKKLILTIDENRIIGIRVPILRKFAKNFYKNDFKEAMFFIKNSSHFYLEEENLHLFLIENIKDFETVINYTEKILPFIDNWQSCDIFYPKIFKNNKDKIYKKILEWINSKDVYTIRFAIKLLLTDFLDCDFKIEDLKIVSSIKSENYYVNMVRAWYFQKALLKQYDFSIKFIENKYLDVFTHNKAIQKAIESKCIDFHKKKYLKTLKIKKEM